MARTWISIQVELIEGRGERYWPRPGRIFGAARTHTFAQLSDAIDDAFARWDRSHLWAFRFPENLRIEIPVPEWGDEIPGEVLDAHRTKLGRLRPGEQFVYEFDFGDSWMHLCTVGESRIDPMEEIGIEAPRPLPYEGWGGHPRPVRATVGRRRWRVTRAPRPGADRSLPLPPSLGSRSR